MRIHKSFATRTASPAVIAGVFTFLLLLLGGCGLTVNNPALFPTGPVTSQPGPNGATAVPIQGYVGGPQWRVTAAAVQLFAMGTNGAGSASTPLGQPVTTDSSGAFLIIQPYTCPSPASQLYLVAQGGNPGLDPGVDNQALRLLTYLGACNQVSASTVYPINEVTTVGSIWPLAGWMTSDTELGTTASNPSFPSAVQKIGQLVNLGQGISPGTGIPSGYAVQTSKLYTLASVLHTCVVSEGGNAGDDSPCGQLLTLTTMPGGLPPTNTIDAALHLAQANQLNVANLYLILPASPAFLPDLADVPTDWDLNLVPIPAPPTISPQGGTYASGQEITLSSNNSGARIHYTLDGSAPSIQSAAYAGPLTLTSAVTVNAIAFIDEIGSSVASAIFNVAASAPTPPAPPVTASSLVFTIQPSNTLAGVAINPSPVVRVVDSSGNLIANSTAAITLGVTGNGGLLSGTVTVNAVGGVATFPGLSIAVPSSAYTLTASSSGLTSAVSTAFTVTATTTPAPPVTASSLVFTTQPSNTLAGVAINPSPVVQVVDSSGKLVANSTEAITLGVTGSSGLLSGTVTVNAVGGVATFPGLSIAVPSSAYTLTASSSGLTSAVSTGFTVTAPAPVTVPITILQNSAPQITAMSGGSFDVTYNWNASPLAANDTVFVNFVASDGTIAFEDNHQPPVPTSQWSGAVSYTRTVQVPAAAASGTYRIIAGLTAASGALGLTPGPGVTVAGAGQYQTGTLTVAPTCSIASFGAVGDGVTDNANALQQTFNYAQQRGCIALVPAGRFAYSGTVTATGIAVAGNGAASILAPLDATNEALILSGNGVSLSNLSMVSTGATRLTTPWSGMVWCENASNYYVENVLINNSSSVGIMSYNSHDGFVSQNTVENTLADSITQINGSYNITVSGNRILNSGDDGISNNSYIGQPLDHDITVRGNTVLNNLWGRGLEVSGGSSISFSSNYVSNPDGFSDMYIASENEWSTQGVDTITVSNNTFMLGGPNQGAVTVYNSQGTLYSITNVLVDGNTFIAPPYVALEFVGNGSETGLVVKDNTDYSTGTFSAATDPLASFTQTLNQVLAPSSNPAPGEPQGRGCHFTGC